MLLDTGGVRTDVETLLRNATDEELPAIAAAIQRTQAKPAVVVTVGGKPARRYVVAQEDEDEVRALIGVDKDDWPQHVWVGAQWLRGMGNVDEMYRSLGLWEVAKVTEVERSRVWGRELFGGLLASVQALAKAVDAVVGELP